MLDMWGGETRSEARPCTRPCSCPFQSPPVSLFGEPFQSEYRTNFFATLSIRLVSLSALSFGHGTSFGTTCYLVVNLSPVPRHSRITKPRRRIRVTPARPGMSYYVLPATFVSVNAQRENLCKLSKPETSREEGAL